MSAPMMRVGILAQGGVEWLGGVHYVNNLFKSLALLPRAKRPHLSLVIQEHHIPAFECYVQAAAIADQVLVVYPESMPPQGAKVKVVTSMDDLFKQIDFVYPVNSTVLPGKPAASWIPDFQHRYLPRFFTKQELEKRDAQFGMIAEKARLIIFSSESARADFKRFYPGSPAVTRVLRFSAIPELSWFEGDAEAVRIKHGLPEDFLMCSNQFWEHKDHRTLFRALAVLRAKGITPHVACTGHTEDYRNPAYFHGLMREVRSLGIQDQVHILGVIARQEQIILLRRAMAVVQPSLFEGWSTVVEDCRVLGKTMFLSDFPVHVEQNPDHGIYFKQGNAHDLAEKLARHMAELARTDNSGREHAARAAASERMMLFGLEFSRIAAEGALLMRS